MTKEVEGRLGGKLDGIYCGNLAITVPASTEIDNIRAVFDAFTSETGLQWYFANVYKNFEDVNDETLLDWWR